MCEMCVCVMIFFLGKQRQEEVKLESFGHRMLCERRKSRAPVPVQVQTTSKLRERKKRTQANFFAIQTLCMKQTVMAFLSLIHASFIFLLIRHCIKKTLAEILKEKRVETQKRSGRTNKFIKFVLIHIQQFCIEYDFVVMIFGFCFSLRNQDS